MNRGLLEPLPIYKYAISTNDVEKFLIRSVPDLAKCVFSTKPVRFGSIMPLELYIIPTIVSVEGADDRTIDFKNRFNVHLNANIEEYLKIYAYPIGVTRERKKDLMNEYNINMFNESVAKSFKLSAFGKENAFYILMNPYTLFIDMLDDVNKKSHAADHQILITECRIFNDARSGIYIVEETIDPSFKLDDIYGSASGATGDANSLIALERVMKSATKYR